MRERISGKAIMTTPTPPVGSLSKIRFKATEDTPTGFLQYDGLTALCLPEWLQTAGSSADNPGSILGVTGYPMMGADGVTEYMMTGPVDAVTREFLRTLPDAGAWTDPAQLLQTRTALREMMRDNRVPAIDARALTKQIHDAAVVNERARVAATR